MADRPDEGDFKDGRQRKKSPHYGFSPDVSTAHPALYLPPGSRFVLSSSTSNITTNCQLAAQLLRDGKLVAFPTETVYGLGADATNRRAVAMIFEAKQRPFFDPLIVHVAELAQLKTVAREIPAAAQKLAEAIWPGPLTLVLPKQPCIPDLVTAGLPGVGVRIPRHPLAIELLKAAGCPVAAPSANPFGGISPTTAQHVHDGLGAAVHCILDGGPCAVGVESTVVSFMDSRPVILRPGGCPVEEIEAVLGSVERAVSGASGEDSAQLAPGMLSRHYAPGTRLLLVEQNQLAIPVPELRSGLLTYGNQPFVSGFEQILNLADSGNLQICAAEFFAALRSLDSSGLDVIIAHQFPNHGLGVALNDRLQRAAWRKNESV